MQRILIATDAFDPQINGVVRTLKTTATCLRSLDCEVKFVAPHMFTNISWPWYRDIKLSFVRTKQIAKLVCDFAPNYIHIATEGPIGFAMRNYCVRNNIKFTTSYHTKFPEYLQIMYRIPANFTYKYFEWFHRASSKVLAPTHSIAQELRKHGFHNVCIWDRGVDIDVFKPQNTCKCEKARLIYVGRVSAEKNIEAFLNLQLDCEKMVVGDGPIRQELQHAYPHVKFVGAKSGQELTDLYASADVFVFPSKTDTFGLVLLESLACGVPFAAYEEPGPLHIYNTDMELGNKCCFVHSDLQIATQNALQYGCKKAARELAVQFSWHNCAKKFLEIIRNAHEI